MELAPPRAPGRLYAGNFASGNARVQYGDIHGNVTYNVYEVRQERIGIEASISGLRSLTNSIHTSLCNLKPDHGVRSSTVAGLLNEVTFSKTSLDALNYKLSWLHNTPEQAALVKLDQLVILRANAIVLFDRSRTSLTKDTGMDLENDNGLQAFLLQLQEHNMAWKLQLDLMDRHTTAESDAIASNLDSATNKLLRENADLKRRMDAFQNQLEQMTKQLSSSAASIRPDSGSSSTSSLATDTDDESMHSAASSFEETLNSSWVYRRNEHRSEVMSIDTSLQRDYAWSEMSELTLANKSALSVLALPITISELAHGECYQNNAQTAALSSTRQKFDLNKLAKKGPEAWRQLSEDQRKDLIEQLMEAGPAVLEKFRLKPPPNPIQRARDAARSFGLLGKRTVLERDAIRLIGESDFRSFKQCWGMYDPKSTMFISKEASQRLMGTLPYSFGFRIYPPKYRIPNILCTAREALFPTALYQRIAFEEALSSNDARALRHLSQALLLLSIDEIRLRKTRMLFMYTEIMLTADPDRGISFMSLLIICAMWRDETQTFRQDDMEKFLRRRARTSSGRDSTPDSHRVL
ncbi:hypothetical protein AC579_422 [Pseudocercospora musae]|uniref:Uncharacterized protein n=1 Tax=Pseudocercospora musae TaxID=113226 RepID=A0A139HJB6_9PEZI|nr:hypothetical protein AC579_422 [Pseudocercospora musae]